ncbi:hypothetical protein NIES22_47560 [Calothrix brevissima NIES-22]|nr:hypothetical protein NIES22_47560 [Calothrix brevissima NIES-22]
MLNNLWIKIPLSLMWQGTSEKLIYPKLLTNRCYFEQRKISRLFKTSYLQKKADYQLYLSLTLGKF